MKASELYYRLVKRTGVYNIMPIENIPSVITNGILSNNEAKRIKHRSVAMPEIPQRRDKVKVPNGLDLHSYANAYFDPRNPMMYKLHSNAEMLCVLKINAAILDLDDVIVSDRNASCEFTRFEPSTIGIGHLDFQTIFLRDWCCDDMFKTWDQKAKKCAEILVPNLIPYSFIDGAFVVDENSKLKLFELGFSKKIAINKDIFFR